MCQHVPRSNSKSQSLLTADQNRIEGFWASLGAVSLVSIPNLLFLLFLCRLKMIPPLPEEVWDAIAEFLRSESLSQVCKRLRKVLGSHRYVKIKCGAEQIVACIEGLMENVRALNYGGASVRNIGDSGAQALAALKKAPSLHTLTLEFQHHSIADSGAQALAALKEAPSLHTLTLNLSSFLVGDLGAHLYYKSV